MIKFCQALIVKSQLHPGSNQLSIRDSQEGDLRPELKKAGFEAGEKVAIITLDDLDYLLKNDMKRLER